MAEDEEKKPSKLKSTPGEVFGTLFAFYLGALLLQNLLENIRNGEIFGWLAPDVLVEYFQDFLPLFQIFAIIFSGAFIVGLIYLNQAIGFVREFEKERLYQKKEEEPIVNNKWERVLDHITSSKESDWRLAILEADIILDEMLDAMGYRGETMAEKLKQIEKSDFTTLDKAWEAHKIRNAIAHEGGEFHVSEREAKRVITLYRNVFEEFYYI